MTWNLLHVADVLRRSGGLPIYGNDRKAWADGERLASITPQGRVSLGSPLAPGQRAAFTLTIPADEVTFAADLTTSAQVMEAVRRSAGAAHRRLVADGRAARTVTVKVRRPDFSIATRSASLPTPTSSLEAIVRVAGRLAPDPVAFGAIRLLGVGVSGLTEIVQDPLFEELPWEGAPGAGHAEETDLDAEPPDIQALGTTVTTEADADADGEGGVDGEGGGTSAIPAIGAWRGATDVRWPTGADVAHPEYGHGWVQGSGRGRVSVRFETATTGPGRMRTFAEDDPELRTADPRDSLG